MSSSLLSSESESRAVALSGAMHNLACRYLLGLVPKAEYKHRLRGLVAEYQRLRRARS